MVIISSGRGVDVINPSNILEKQRLISRGQRISNSAAPMITSITTALLTRLELASRLKYRPIRRDILAYRACFVLILFLEMHLLLRPLRAIAYRALAGALMPRGAIAYFGHDFADVAASQSPHDIGAMADTHCIYRVISIPPLVIIGRA